MPLAPQQIRKLRARLKSQHIRTREADGRTIAYLEGWHVIAEANRIFGFDGWDRELVDSACVYTKQQGERFNAAYTARIRIKVRAGENIITREGSGAGEASASSPGQAHELAMKAAETDATKRALMTFGNPFGLSLYGPAKDATPPAPTLTSGPVGKFNGYGLRPAQAANNAPPENKSATTPEPVRTEAPKEAAIGNGSTAKAYAVRSAALSISHRKHRVNVRCQQPWVQRTSHCRSNLHRQRPPNPKLPRSG